MAKQCKCTQVYCKECRARAELKKQHKSSLDTQLCKCSLSLNILLFSTIWFSLYLLSHPIRPSLSLTVLLHMYIHFSLSLFFSFFLSLFLSFYLSHNLPSFSHLVSLLFPLLELIQSAQLSTKHRKSETSLPEMKLHPP